MDDRQKYEQAIENINKIKAANKDNKELMDFIEYKYPELKVSEGERIRKALIELVRMVNKNPIHQIFSCGDIKHSDMIAWLKKQGKQKHVDIQSIEKRAHEVFPDDDDENTPLYRQAFIDGAVDYIDCGCKKSSAWSEEDERMINSVIKNLDEGEWFDIYQADWLKSLKERYTWKPSEEQMESLQHAIDSYSFPSTRNAIVLKSLYEELKKLRKE